MDANMTDDEIGAELSAVLAGLVTGSVSRMGAGNDDIESARAYLRALAPGGWAVPTWPEGLGGCAASAVDALRIAGALAKLPKPDLYPFQVGLDLVGPSLLVHGTEDQKRRWLPRIADGGEIWCQMFSEPSAGSDLANVATRAFRDGDGDSGDWVLTGQKVWTSRGAYADWGICLARTDPDVPKHRGLTAFAVTMDAPGVTVRMLKQMNGDRHFSEVFLDQARIPDAQRIGAVGEGWKVAQTVLTNERTGIKDDGGTAHSPAAAPEWLADLAAAGLLSDPLLLDRALGVYVEECVVEMMRARAAADAKSGNRTPGPEGSGQKLRSAAVFRRRAELIKDAQGLDGLLSTTPGNLEFLTAPSMSIRGGTDEIQRNIIGERVLGLEREPRFDHQGPWSQTRSGS